jgi:cytochrome c peroxidase
MSNASPCTTDRVSRFADPSRPATGGRLRAWCAGLAALSLLGSAQTARAHGTIPPSLAGVEVPAVPGLLSGHDRLVRNRRHAIALGKALFWDIQVGSDGMACASCHYHAGADARIANQLSPGHAPDTRPTAATFEPVASAADGGANYVLRRADFPLHQLADPTDFASAVLFTTDDVVGSAGSFGGQFHHTVAASPDDDCTRVADPVFNVQGVGTRRVTSRNAPSVINAVFNQRLFWDGRANNVFNGVNAFGDRDPAAGVWLWQGRHVSFARLALPNAALASQAVVPPVDANEMSCSGRTFADIGRKLLRRRPLQLQAVHPDDSVLGKYRHPSGDGLELTYEKLVRKAFRRRFWSAPRAKTQGAFGAPASGGEPYTQSEANFALFFGLALQLYESTLVSDQAPFDSARDADGVPSALDAQQRRGLIAFVDFHCANCHAGPTLSGGALVPQAAVSDVDRKPIRAASGAMVIGLADAGFINTGVVAQDHDAGLGALDPFGNPLSFTAQYLDVLQGVAAAPLDPMRVQSCAMTAPYSVAAYGLPAFAANELIPDPAGSAGCESPLSAQIPAAAVAAQELAAADHGRLPDGTVGAFKVPSLRNVELTGPYMHNGSMASLDEVLQFYNRGGNFASQGRDAQFLFGMGVADETLADIAAFLTSLTDERVRWERAPFDHPALPLANGHVGDAAAVSPDGRAGFAGLAATHVVEIPAVGSAGRDPSSGPLLPLTARLSP